MREIFIATRIVYFRPRTVGGPGENRVSRSNSSLASRARKKGGKKNFPIQAPACVRFLPRGLMGGWRDKGAANNARSTCQRGGGRRRCYRGLSRPTHNSSPRRKVPSCCPDTFPASVLRARQSRRGEDASIHVNYSDYRPHGYACRNRSRNEE